MAASPTLAQFGTFVQAFEGQLWRVEQELPLANAGTPGGSVFVNSMLLVADQTNGKVVAYNENTWAVVPMAAADWNQSATVGNPAFGLVPNEMATGTVIVDSVTTTAVFISDLAAPRMLAFTAAGAHLFTLQLDNPLGVNDVKPLINAVAMGPGATFTLNTTAATLSLQGAFAAAWTNEGRNHGAALAFKDVAAFTPNGPARSFGSAAAQTQVLDGTEGVGVGPASYETYGLVFDAAGNLYTTDTFTERINVYDANFNHRFRFGAPEPFGTGVVEFAQPFGLAYWPDANGGRLFVGDVLNNRIAVYRPDIAGGTLTYVTSVNDFPPAIDPQPFSIAIDPAAGLIAASDFAVPSVWVLKTADLVAYDIQVLNDTGSPIDTVCAGTNYQVRFSVTVPAGHPLASGVGPRLTLGAVEQALSAATPAATFDLNPGETATFTYALTMSAGAAVDLNVIASATTTSATTDILERRGTIAVSDCPVNNLIPEITAQPSVPPQLSGWTATYDPSFSVTLTATDDGAIRQIEYRLTGTNDTGATIPPVVFSGTLASEAVTVPLPEPGSSTIEFRARDNYNTWSPWKSLAVRLGPIVDRSSNEGVQETFTFGLPATLEPIEFSATGLPPGVTIAASTGQISGTLAFAAAGVHAVTVTERLGVQSSSFGFTWTVNDVNRPPTITPILPADIPPVVEGQYFEIIVRGGDPDGDPSFFSAYGRSIPLGYELPREVRIDPVSGKISGFFPLDSQPAYTIVVGLSECAATALDDPIACVGARPRLGLATLMEITINVTNTNQPPTVVNPGTQANREGNAITLPIVASDPDLDRGDALQYLAANLPLGLSINPSTGVISGTIAVGALPSYNVIVQVRDQVGALPLPFVQFLWTITELNRAPTISSGPRTSIENETTNVTIAHNDPDGDILTFTMVGLPATHTINNLGVISGTFSYESAGDYVVTVTVSDGSKTASTTFNWKVLNVNRSPVLSVAAQVSAEGQTVTLPIQGSDPDGDALTFTMNGLPPSFAIDPSTGIIRGTFDYDSAGVYTVNVGVVDSALGVVKSFRWVVTDTSRPPVVNPIADRNDTEGDVINLPAIPATDPDGDLVFSYAATNLPAGLAINPATGAITGTLLYTAAGTYFVTITVSDARGATATVPFTWTVANRNRPPTVASIDRANAENDTVSYVTTASDPDLDTLTYSATGLPPGISVSSTTGVVAGTLGYNTAGTYNPTITVSDGSLTASARFVWVVTETNAPPVVIHPGNLENDEGETISRQIIATDADGFGTLTFTATGLPPGLAISPSGLITGTLSYSSAGVYSLSTVTVTDGVDRRSVTFTWTVHNVNPPPVGGGDDGETDPEEDDSHDVNRPPVANSDSAVVVQGQSVSISVLANDTDPEGQNLSIVSVTTPTSGFAVINSLTGTITYTALATFVGNATFSYTISDGATTASAAVTVAVTPSNHPPMCTAAAAAPGLVWPPNHQAVYVTITGVTDPDGGTPTITFTSILQDEPIDSEGDGNTLQDAGITQGSAMAWVRAERAGTGDGRVYILGFTATDANGESCSGTVTAGVPHDQGNSNPPILSPGRWNSITGQLVSAPPPVANDDSFTVAKSSQVEITVLANDVVFASAPEVTIVSAPTKGTATVNLDGTITYRAPSQAGKTSFTYEIADSVGSDTAVVNIVIGGQSTDDCGDPSHDHKKDADGRDRDHRDGKHDRCKHPAGDSDKDQSKDKGRDGDNDKENDGPRKGSWRR